MDYKALPKIDLHCHLDGSVRPETLFELAKERNIPVTDLETLRASLIAPEDCPSLDEYLKRFDMAKAVMQDQESIERITYELFEDAANENVKYMEVRFGPLLHLDKELTLDQIIQSVIKGMNRAESSLDIHGGIILSVLRTMPKDRIEELLMVGANYLEQGVVGFDLASSEIENFCYDFKTYVDKAKALGYHITVHAGETGIGQNVYDAVELLGAERIGHGIHIASHQSAYDIVKDRRVVLETCPSSNVQTKAVSSMREHPFDDFYQDALKVSINTDNRTVSNTTMTREIQRVVETFNYDMEDYKVIYKNSVYRAFTTNEIKAKLLSYIE